MNARLQRFLYRDRSRSEWIASYAKAHQHPVNRACHTWGIPLVTLSIIGLLLSLVWSGLLYGSVALFVVGWMLQFIGHAFEGKPPEFFKDWRYLLVGLAWWWAKLRRKL